MNRYRDAFMVALVKVVVLVVCSMIITRIATPDATVLDYKINIVGIIAAFSLTETVWIRMTK